LCPFFPEGEEGGEALLVVAISAAALGEALPVGPVSRFRSADGQLAGCAKLSWLTTGLGMERLLLERCS
jgi:hypothetical protein